MSGKQKAGSEKKHTMSDSYFEVFCTVPFPVFLTDDSGKLREANAKGLCLLQRIFPNSATDRPVTSAALLNPEDSTAFLSLLKPPGGSPDAWNEQVVLRPQEPGKTEPECYKLHAHPRQTGGFILHLEPTPEATPLEAGWQAFFIAVEESPTTIVITNLKGEIQYANQAFERSSGYKREEVLGKNPRFLKSGLQSKEFYEELWSNLSAGKTWEGAFQNRKKDGSLYWEQASIGPVHGEDQRITGYIAIKQDITKQREAEERMEHLNLSILRTKRRLEETNALALVGSWELDLEKNHVYLSKVVRRIHEIPEDARVSLEEGLSFYKEGESREKLRNAVEQAISQGTPFDVEAEFITAKGNHRWVRAVGLGELVDGKCRRIFGSFQDITAQKSLQIQLEAALMEERRQHRFIADLTNSLPVAVLQRDLKGNFLDCNPAAEALTGYTREEYLSLCLAERDGEVIAAIARAEDDLLLSGKLTVYRTEREILHKDRRVLPVLISKALIHDEHEKPLRIVTVLVDISEAKKLEYELRRAKLDADSANRAKSAFLATMSHEIRTPLNAVIGMASLLAETTMNSDQRTYANTILTASHSLLDLIDDILDYSKIESRKLTLNNDKFQLADTLRETVLLFQSASREKNVSIETTIDPRIPDQIVGDRVRIKQVLLNLLGNAVKFTKQGTVSATLSLLEQSEKSCKVGFCIEDTGIGISKEAQSRLFKPFTQADSSTTREFGGSGLGLAISQRIVELMGGKIQVHSEEGKGSTFSFALRFSTYQPPLESGLILPAASNGSFEPGTLRVLVAEDNENNRTVLRLLLQKLGISAHMVENGAEALQAVGQQDFDVILLDIQMPVMDGITAIRSLKANTGWKEKKMYCIALTANAFVEDEQQCLAAGFDQYLSKPITLGQLREGLQTASAWLAKARKLSHVS